MAALYIWIVYNFLVKLTSFTEMPAILLTFHFQFSNQLHLNWFEYVSDRAMQSVVHDRDERTERNKQQQQLILLDQENKYDFESKEIVHCTVQAILLPHTEMWLVRRSLTDSVLDCDGAVQTGKMACRDNIVLILPPFFASLSQNNKQFIFNAHIPVAHLT